MMSISTLQILCILELIFAVGCTHSTECSTKAGAPDIPLCPPALTPCRKILRVGISNLSFDCRTQGKEP